MLSVERLPRCVLAVGMAALFLVAACEATLAFDEGPGAIRLVFDADGWRPAAS